MNDPLASDAGGYGDVVAVFEGEKIVHMGRVPARVSKLPRHQSVTFVGSKYALVVSRHIAHLYRGFDSLTDDSLVASVSAPQLSLEFATVRGSLILGSGNGVWLTPMRPTIIEESRRLSAVKHEWNRMDYILDASLRPGARIYVGRAASQRNVFRGRASVLVGGAMQILVPRDQVLFLRRNKVSAVR